MSINAGLVDAIYIQFKLCARGSLPKYLRQSEDFICDLISHFFPICFCQNLKKKLKVPQISNNQGSLKMQLLLFVIVLADGENNFSNNTVGVCYGAKL